MINIILNNLFANVDWHEITQATMETFFMLGFASLFSALIGIPVGVLLFLTTKSYLWHNKPINRLLSFFVNILRALPFIILLIILMPITTILVGTSLGAKGAILPLVVGSFPFFARLIENALKELDEGILQMALSCGANTWQIVWRVLLPEILPNIIASVTVTTIALLSYSAMAGAIGGGGLGDLAIRYGYQRYQINVMVITVFLMVAIVQLIQLIGDLLIFLLRRKAH